MLRHFGISAIVKQSHDIENKHLTLCVLFGVNVLLCCLFLTVKLYMFSIRL